MERYLDNYVPCAKRQCVDEEDILPNVEVDAIVYAYCQNVSGCSRTDDVPLYDSSVHGAPVYVGQTIQDITARDKQHRSYTATPFDKHYTNSTQYTLVILCRRTFAPATTPSAFRDDTLRPAAEWMDFKEAHFISHFNTYHNGWNSTKGGQGRAWLVVMREARAKASAKRFETEYMPKFRHFHEEHGHINVPQSHPVLGKLVNSIRSGHTAIPSQYEDEFKEWGFFWCTQNLARNVSRMLGRTVVSLEDDAVAMDAVAASAVHHATLLALRSTLTKEERKVSGLTRIPFGNKTIGDGVARFYADAASMEGEERDVVEETYI